MGLSASRDTLWKGAVKKALVSLKASQQVYKGGIVAVDSSGYGVPGQTATGLTVMGIATADALGSGSNGGVSVEVEMKVVKLDNSGGDACDITCIGQTVYMVDDHTVSKTNGSSSESAAGKCIELDADGGIWVDIGVID